MKNLKKSQGASARDIEKVQRTLDRAAFVPAPYKGMATEDHPLPIGHDQTISQPSLVTMMTMLLQLEPTHRVLEIGTGSGYQTALLASFCHTVYTVERILPLLNAARNRLQEMGVLNICYKVGDGTEGWQEKAPFDRIVVTAGASRVPPVLVKQLAKGGILVIPVGDSFQQDLLVLTKDEKGVVKTQAALPVRFVELVGDSGWERD